MKINSNDDLRYVVRADRIKMAKRLEKDEHTNKDRSELSNESPNLTHSGSSLTPQRMEKIIQRIKDKFYDKEEVLEEIASRTSLVIDAGGGLRSDEDLRVVFESGASMVTGGSIAVKDRELFLSWLEKYGAGRIILGADFRKGRVAVSGWHETTGLALADFINNYREQGIEKVICTDIDRDGMLEGPSFKTYLRIKEKLGSLYLVASGGISEMKDIERLEEAGVEGVILGKALYEKRISLKVLENYIVKNR